MRVRRIRRLTSIYYDLIKLKSSNLVKYSNPKINSIKLIKDTFCMMANKTQLPEPYKNRV